MHDITFEIITTFTNRRLLLLHDSLTVMCSVNDPRRVGTDFGSILRRPPRQGVLPKQAHASIRDEIIVSPYGSLEEHLGWFILVA